MDPRPTGAAAHGIVTLRREAAAPLAPVRLVCLGHAGATGYEYASWPAALAESAEVWSVVLPGRGPRRSQGGYTRMAPLVEDLVSVLAPLLDRPLLLFGHSLGALVAFEAARALRRRLRLTPSCLLASGCPAPHLVRPDADLESDAALVARLWRAGGTPLEVLRDPDLLGLVLPVIRADLEVYHTYVHAPEDPLGCPIVALGGAEDESVGSAALEAWREHTRGAFERAVVAGGHFFVRSAQGEVLEWVRRSIARSAEASRRGETSRS
jgi:medium-chain acyl-[acyl-carrier-protein] hydrolase